MRLLWVALIACPAAAAVWALAPIPKRALPAAGPPPAPASAGPSGTALAALDTAAFRAPLWVAPAPPPPPAPAPPPPPPSKLQLLAVIREGGRHKAMLYDPDADRIIVAGDGDRLKDGTVERVTERGVEIRGPAGLRALALRADQGAAP